MSAAPFLRRVGVEVELAVKVTPRARRSGIDDVVTDAAGAQWLGVKVREVPENGRASLAVQRLIAERCGLPQAAVRLASGGASRWKRLRLQGDADEIARRLAASPTDPRP